MKNIFIILIIVLFGCSTQQSKISEEEVKEVMKEKPIKVEAPLMRYFDLVDDSSPSYVLGYN